LATCAILLAYSAFISAVRPDLEISYDSGARNRAIADNYVDRPDGRAVLVGSSLAYMLSKEYVRADALGPEIYNLAFMGGHAATALDIIIRKAQWPRLVLVEMNIMDRGYDLDFARRPFAQPWRAIRTAIPGFRPENRPFDLGIVALWKFLRDDLGSGVVTQPKLTSNPPRVDKEPPIDEFRAKIAASLAMIRDQVAVLHAHGVRVVLVHFPVHPAVENDPRTRYQWQKIYEAFPPDQNEWLEFDRSGSYETTDGSHLTIPSARRFAAALRQFVDDDPRHRPPESAGDHRI
jgi:hypothetical protein